jgi:hypothetical protein
MKIKIVDNCICVFLNDTRLAEFIRVVDGDVVVVEPEPMWKLVHTGPLKYVL